MTRFTSSGKRLRSSSEDPIQKSGFLDLALAIVWHFYHIDASRSRLNFEFTKTGVLAPLWLRGIPIGNRVATVVATVRMANAWHRWPLLATERRKPQEGHPPGASRITLPRRHFEDRLPNQWKSHEKTLQTVALATWLCRPSYCKRLSIAELAEEANAKPALLKTSLPRFRLRFVPVSISRASRLRR